MDWEQERSSSSKENGSGWRASKSRRCNQENVGTCMSGDDEERKMDQTAGQEWRLCSEAPDKDVKI